MRRLLPLCAVALALALPAPASAIVNGEAAAQGEFPSHGLLLADNNEFPGFDRFCGGTLIGSRQFLTAANCVADGAVPLPVGKLVVHLGNIARNASSPDAYGVTNIELAPGYKAAPFPANDAAVLTLDRVADYEPTRVLDAGEADLWDVGAVGTIVGWGRVGPANNFAQTLRKTDVPITDPARCVDGYSPSGDVFDEDTMLCAADPADTPIGQAHDSCEGDEGGPLLVSDANELPALAGVISWLRSASCGNPARPAVLTRLGDGALNSWVHSRTPEADFTLSHQPRAGEPVTLENTSRHPDGASYFTTFRWDLDNDGRFDDATGATISHPFPQAGLAVAGLEASRPGGDKASVYYAFEVEPAPVVAPPPGGGTPTTPATPPTTTRVPAPLATILVSGRPKVRNRRFAIRVRFAADAPRGTAVIEVYRGNRRIGIARTKVARGATKRVRVKLTPQGRRMLRRAETKRLKIRVRVRVGREVLRTKRLTIRR
jgi:hypothetical protein